MGQLGKYTRETTIRKDARTTRQDYTMGHWQEGVPLHGFALRWGASQSSSLWLPPCQGLHPPGEKEVLHGELGRGSSGIAPRTTRISLPERQHPGATMRSFGRLRLHHCRTK